jgi:pimeloyl-ACP methyl ester carboxylesterase
MKPKMVMIHGYGSSSVLFYRIIKYLMVNFQIYLIDMLGMGGSSRPDDFDKDNFSVQ